MTKMAMVVAVIALAGCSAETADEPTVSGSSAIMVQDLRITDERGSLQSEVDPESHAYYGAMVEIRDTSLSIDDQGNLEHGSIHVSVKGAAGGGDTGTSYHAPYRLGVAAAVLARCGVGGWHLVEYTDQKASWGQEDLSADWRQVFGGIAPANVHCNGADDIELGLGVWYAAYTYAPSTPTGERAVVQRWHCLPRAACSALSATSD